MGLERLWVAVVVCWALGDMVGVWRGVSGGSGYSKGYLPTCRHCPGWWGSGRGLVSSSIVVGPWVLGGTSFVSWA